MSYLFKDSDKNEVTGVFTCFTCDNTVREAWINEHTGTLQWECDNGHPNEVQWQLPKEEQ